MWRIFSFKNIFFYRELARKETQLHIQLSSTRDELRKCQDSLRSVMNKVTIENQIRNENKNLFFSRVQHPVPMVYNVFFVNLRMKIVIKILSMVITAH